MPVKGSKYRLQNGLQNGLQMVIRQPASQPASQPARFKPQPHILQSASLPSGGRHEPEALKSTAPGHQPACKIPSLRSVIRNRRFLLGSPFSDLLFSQETSSLPLRFRPDQGPFLNFCGCPAKPELMPTTDAEPPLAVIWLYFPEEKNTAFHDYE